MSAFFSGLTKRQTMLLLTAVTFGGQDGVAAFAWLPEEEGKLLGERARQLMAIPREKRLPFLIQEIKRNVANRKPDELLAQDPESVAQAIAKERPSVKEVILRGLPVDLAREVRKRLGIGELVLSREVKPEVLSILRWKLEVLLGAKGGAPRAAPAFSMGDLLVLTERDLCRLADALGAKVLAPTLNALPEAERDALFRKLSAEQRQLMQRALTEVEAARRPAPADPAKALATVLNGKDIRQAVRQVGVRRVAAASLGQSAEFAARVIERHHSDFGRQLASSVSEERHSPRRQEGVKEELLAELESLAAAGFVERPVRLRPPSPPGTNNPSHSARPPLPRPGARPTGGPRSGPGAR